MGKHLVRKAFFKSKTYLLLALLTALFCSISPPLFAKIPATTSIISNVTVDRSESSDLLLKAKQLYDRQQYQEAISILEQVLTIYQTQGNSLKQALTLSNLSLAYQQLGLWKEANKAISNSLKILQNIENNRDRSLVLAQTLDIQGRLQLATGKSEDAVSSYEEAAKIYQQLGDKKSAIESNIDLSQALQDLGLSRKAISLLQDIEQTLLEQPNSHTLVIAERNLGDALLVTGDLKQSRTVLENSLKLAEELQLPEEIAAANMSLGNLARAEALEFLKQNNLTLTEVGFQLDPPQDRVSISFQRRRAKIIEDFYQQTEKGLGLYDRAASKAINSNTQLQAQLNQLNLLIITQRWQGAQKLYSEIESQIDRLPISHRNIYDRIDLAQNLLKLLGQDPELSEKIKHILTVANQQAKQIGDDRARSYALTNLGIFYEQTQQYSQAKIITEQALTIAQAIDAGDISFRSFWQLGRILEIQGDRAGAIAAYAEAVKTLGNLRNDLVAVNRNIQFSFQETIEPVYHQLVDLLLSKNGNNKPSKESLIQARNVIEGLRVAELDNFFQEACLDSKFNLEAVVKKENLSAALFYTIVLPDRIEVILKLPQQDLIAYSKKISQERVKSILETLVQEIKKPYISPTLRSLSEQVYDWLIRPAETALKSAKVETLVFVQDSILLNLPISALYNGQQYLIEKYSLALAPGMELFAPTPLKKSRLRILVAGLSEGRNNFSPLTYVKEEVEQIKSTLPSEVIFNQNFTKQNLEREIDSSPFSLVHIATHGQFSSNPEKTFILAWDNPINVNELGRLLRSRELQRSEPLELLVLSACQTAAGDRRASLGLAGIAVKSGAKSTIASLWSIEDRSASLLMRDFYRELANNNISKAEALRRAQKTLLANPQYESPYFWAPYVLLGNWL